MRQVLVGLLLGGLVLSVPLRSAGPAGQAAASTARASATALDRYVAAPDPSFAWTVSKTLPAEGATATLIDLTSQRWLTEQEVEQPLWKHWLVVVTPEKVTSDIGLLFIGGGRNDRNPPATPSKWLVEAARDTGTVVAELRMVPNQPVVFKDDPARKPRTEDDFIAYTWDKFLRTGDDKWPARLPMTKSAVRAMDAVTAFAASAAGGSNKVGRFVVAGASKRGWTTWTTAAVDSRVIAIVPAVIDLLNVEPSFIHHYRAYGAYSDAVKDYVEQGIMDWIGTPQFHALMKIEEPYEYRDRLTMPKLLVNASGDQFFLPDSSQFYFDKLRGENHLRYVPNTNHWLDKSDALETVRGVLCGGGQGHAASRVLVDVREGRRDQGRVEGAAGDGDAVAGDEPRRAEFPPGRDRPGVSVDRADALGPEHLGRPRAGSGEGMDGVLRRAHLRVRRQVSVEVHDRRPRAARHAAVRRARAEAPLVSCAVGLSGLPFHHVSRRVAERPSTLSTSFKKELRGLGSSARSA